MKRFIAEILIYLLRIMEVSVIMNVDINEKERVCKPKNDLSFAWFAYSDEVGFKGWQEIGYCNADDGVVKFRDVKK